MNKFGTREIVYTYLHITLKDHNLKTGDEIIIENAISIDGIPTNVINKNHYIEVLSNSTVRVKLPIYNPIDTKSVNTEFK